MGSLQHKSNFLRKRKHSLFSTSNFSQNVDNVIQDVNYKVKGPNQAWEIKFIQE